MDIWYSMSPRRMEIVGTGARDCVRIDAAELLFSS